MAIVAHAHPFVIGADTHARTHTLAVLTAAGEQVACEQFPTTAAGLARAVAWAARRTGGDLAVLWVVEGTGTYGAGLARAAADAGYQVVEAARMGTRTPGTGKSDPADAARIGAAVLPLDTTRLRRPRTDQGVRAALQVLVSARDHMTSERTATVNALTALVRTTDLGIDARRPLTNRQTTQISGWTTQDLASTSTEDLATTTARNEAARLARRVVELDTQIKTNSTDMDRLVRASAAAPLLDTTGIGPVTAAVCLVAWSHPGRVRDQAAFAALAGVNPVPASSGNTVRHRLNRGGDRRLNRALHMATVTRMTHDPETRAYVDKRRAEGRTTKEVRRCLKRYLARRVYRTLTSASTTPDPT